MEGSELLPSDENMGDTCSPLVMGGVERVPAKCHATSLKKGSQSTPGDTQLQTRPNQK